MSSWERHTLRSRISLFLASKASKSTVIASSVEEASTLLASFSAAGLGSPLVVYHLVAIVNRGVCANDCVNLVTGPETDGVGIGRAAAALNCLRSIRWIMAVSGFVFVMQMVFGIYSQLQYSETI